MVPHSPHAPHFLIIPSLMYLHKRGHPMEESDIEASRDMQRLRDRGANAEEERQREDIQRKRQTEHMQRRRETEG